MENAGKILTFAMLLGAMTHLNKCSQGLKLRQKVLQFQTRVRDLVFLQNLQKCQKFIQVPEGKPINAQFQNLGSAKFVLINVEENLKILQKSANRELKLSRP